MLNLKPVLPYLLALLAGFAGMGLWRVVETAWSDHAQIEANETQIETNRTDIQALVNFLNQRLGGAPVLSPAPQPESEDEEGEPTP